MTYYLPETAITRNSIHHMDLFTLCNAMADESVDMILCDLPYGTTACSWDTIIPIKPMWTQFKRIIKPRGAIVLTASQPFTSILVASNLDMFKYSMVWKKNRVTDFIRAKLKPLASHEDVLIFSKGTVANGSNKLMIYNPQMWQSTPYVKKQINYNTGSVVGRRPSHDNFIGTISQSDGERYPTTVIEVDHHNHLLHPTQKPLALFEYLIKTYTKSNHLVFDPCVGSGTTALAAKNTNRDYICGDFTREYVDITQNRLGKLLTFQPSIQKNGMKQLSLFG